MDMSFSDRINNFQIDSKPRKNVPFRPATWLYFNLNLFDLPLFFFRLVVLLILKYKNSKSNMKTELTLLTSPKKPLLTIFYAPENKTRSRNYYKKK